MLKKPYANVLVVLANNINLPSLESQFKAKRDIICYFYLFLFSITNLIINYTYETQRLSKRKNRKPSTGAGRPFKLDTRDRFLMLLVYYTRLYITYTLVGFLLDLDQSNMCRDIQKIE